MELHSTGCVVYVLFTFCAVNCYAVTTTEFLQSLLFDYDSRIPPSFSRKIPTEVRVELHVDTIDSVSESTMDFSANFLIIQHWVDKRLRFYGLIDSPSLELDAKMMMDIWVPDLYFANEKSASFHDVTVPNRMMHLYSNGSITYKARVTMTASCPMYLQRYPMDTQICALNLRSFAYSKTNVILLWEEPDPIQTAIIELPQYKLSKFSHYDCCSYNCSDPSIDNEYSCLRVDFFLERQIGYYLIQIYIPSVMIVALSWVSFWLSLEAVPARISLGILTVLTMTTQKATGNASLPKVSYVKAIDVWMATCLLFVFASLLEYAMANVIMRWEDGRRAMLKVNASTGNTVCEEEAMLQKDVNNTTNHVSVTQFANEGSGGRRASSLDQISRILFPVTFGVFCLAYWIIYAYLIVDDINVMAGD